MDPIPPNPVDDGDPVADVRRVRQALDAQFGYDMRRFVENARRAAR